MKIWTQLQKGEDRIIAHVGDVIYKCNPKDAEADMMARGFEMGIIPEKDMFSIPLYYIDEIRWEEGRKYIQIFFRSSEEHLTIYDETRRSEIFDYFKTILPSFLNTTQRLTPIQAAKKPLIAMVVAGVLFLVTLFFTSTIESGVRYEFSARGSLLTAVIGIASLGTKKVFLIFGSLLTIAGISFARKIRRPLVVHRICKRGN